MRSPHSLLFSRLNTPSSSARLHSRGVQPWEHLHALLWPRSSSSAPFLCWDPTLGYPQRALYLSGPALPGSVSCRASPGAQIATDTEGPGQVGSQGAEGRKRWMQAKGGQEMPIAPSSAPPSSLGLGAAEVRREAAAGYRGGELLARQGQAGSRGRARAGAHSRLVDGAATHPASPWRQGTTLPCQSTAGWGRGNDVTVRSARLTRKSCADSLWCQSPSSAP